MQINTWEAKNHNSLVILHTILLNNIGICYPYDLFIKSIYNSINPSIVSYNKKKQIRPIRTIVKYG